MAGDMLFIWMYCMKIPVIKGEGSGGTVMRDHEYDSVLLPLLSLSLSLCRILSKESFYGNKIQNCSHPSQQIMKTDPEFEIVLRKDLCLLHAFFSSSVEMT